MPTKKRFKFVVIFILLTLVIFFFFYKNKTKKVIQNQTAGVQYKDLTPGKSSPDDIVKTLGNAINEKQDGNNTVLEYKSNNPNFNNQFLITSNTLVFVKQIVTMDEKITISDINQKYGNYTNVLYGPSSVNGFDLYIYPDKGIAYIGHQRADIVLEIWYFPPTDIKTFESLYAKDYSEVITPRQ